MTAITPIESAEDDRLADYRQLTQPAAMANKGLFVAEGRWVVQRLIAGRRFKTQSVLVTTPALAALQDELRQQASTAFPLYVVSRDVMDGIVGFNVHRGCLALAERPPARSFEDVPLDRHTRLLVLEGVNNPDNVGGIFRSAAAFAVDLVVLGPACGDPLYRKAIRTSMGATLDVPYVAVTHWPAALDTLRDAGFHVLALTPAPDAQPIDEVSVPRRVALLLGTEGAGLTAAALSRADARVRIRITDRVDSLNVTVAASIALHHFTVTS
jgi:tRNA G18 (ribose-2'-O)-methylase SpoU